MARRASKRRLNLCRNKFQTNNPAQAMRTGSGFTLIELMVTLTILGLLFVVAVPAFRAMMLNNRLTASSDSLVNYIKLCP